jgi:cell division protein FtsW (lipid II flippase)
MYLKGILFLVILVSSVFVILVEQFSWKLFVLLGLVIWSSARLYYLMFYVIEKYVDPSYRFSGIISFVKYLAKRKR